MPERSGAELLEAIKQYDFRIEVIFLAAQNEASVAVDLMRKGALDFLLKPLELNQLLLSINRRCSSARLMDNKSWFNSRGFRRKSNAPFLMRSTATEASF